MLKKRPFLKRDRVPGVFPAGARIMLIGQAPAGVELQEGYPFAGPSGRELDTWLTMAGIRRRDLAITNVFERPIPEEGGMLAITDDVKRGLPPIAKGRYLIPEWETDLDRLDAEIRNVDPYIIVALGAEALWAVHGTYEISKHRGTLFSSIQGPKALATFHPAYVLRNRSARNICISDMIKAKNLSNEREMVWPKRMLHLDPTIDNLWHFKEQHLDNAPLMFVDIETDPWKLRQITSISFAPSPTVGLCVPFSYKFKSYWPTFKEEVEAIKFVRAVCGLPTQKALQNGLYDAQWLWTEWRVRVRNYIHDTRLLHHAIFPELKKDLGFIGSLWADEVAWKLLGHSEKSDD